MSKSKKIKTLRREYKLNKLSEETILQSPFRQFESWFKDVMKAGFVEPNAMILATVDEKSRPSARVVLLKGFNDKGLTFFTNYNSRKSKELSHNKSAAILFYWDKLKRQVRIEGKIKKISVTESQKYFDTRQRNSRIAAWASEQSKIIRGREYLELQFQKFEKKYPGNKIPVPPNWGGFKLIPEYFEFWQGRESRLHDRISYKKSFRGWKIFRLAP